MNITKNIITQKNNKLKSFYTEKVKGFIFFWKNHLLQNFNKLERFN